MKLTRSQTAWLGVLGAAGVALAVDQLAGGPRAAVGDRPPPPPAPVVVPVVSARKTHPAAAMPSGFDAALAARLDVLRGRIGDDGAARDAFAPSPPWAAAPRPADVDPGRVAADHAAAFERGHVLKATLEAGPGGGGQAVVDGDLLAVGQPIDGFRLVGVGRRRATFAADDGARAELSLPGGDAPAPR